MPVCGMDMRVGGRYQWRWRRDKGGRCRHPRPALDSMPRMPPAAASVLPGGQAEGSPPRTLRVGRSPRSATTVPPRQSARGGSATAERAGWKRRGPRWRCQWGRRPRRARTVAGGPEPPQGRRLCEWAGARAARRLYRRGRAREVEAPRAAMALPVGPEAAEGEDCGRWAGAPPRATTVAGGPEPAQREDCASGPEPAQRDDCTAAAERAGWKRRGRAGEVEAPRAAMARPVRRRPKEEGSRRNSPAG